MGGAIGGAFNAASVYGGIKKVVTAADTKAKEITLLSSTNGLTEASDQMIQRAYDLNLTPIGTDAASTALVNQRITTLRQEIRKGAHELVGPKEAEFGNVIGDSLDMLSGDQIANVISGAKQIVRPGYELIPAEGNTVGYVRLHGSDGVGDIKFDPPKKTLLNLADTQTGKEAIDKFVDSAKFGERKDWRMETAGSMDEIEARYIWAEQKASYKEGMIINDSDIPLLEGAARSKLDKVNVTDTAGNVVVYKSSDLQDLILSQKRNLAEDLSNLKGKGWNFNAGSGPGQNVSTVTTDEIAKALNVSPRFLESDSTASAFARQDAQKSYDKMRADAGLKGTVDLTYVPQHAAIVYDTTRAAHANSDLASAMINVQTQKKIMQDKANIATAKVFGELESRFTPIPQDQIATSNRYGAGAGVLSSANGGYNTLASSVENIGKATADLISQTKKATLASIESPALRLRSDQAGAIEFSKINDLRNSTTERYVINDTRDGLIAKATKDYNDAIAAGKQNVKIPVLQEGAPDTIKIANPNARDAIFADIEANGARVNHENNLRQAEGAEGTKSPDVFYGYKPDPKQMKFFAFVKDETITGQAAGHTSMIHAADEVSLQKMIEAARERTGFKVYTKEDTKNFFEAQKSYEFDRTMHENYIDSSLKSAGVNNNFFPKTDANAIVDEWLASHAKRDAALARDAVAVKYGNEFDQLEQLGKQYTGVASSQYGTTVKSIESTVQNPYNDYRKTALNISRLGEYPLLSSVNRGLENAVSGTVQKLVDAWKEVKTVGDLDKINGLLADAGISHAYKNAAEVILANHTVPKPYLSNFIRGANSILANTFLRLDFLNPVANAVGAQVLLGHETSGQVKALLRDTAGVTVPGTTDKILSPLGFIAKANADYVKSTPELDALFKLNGLTSSTRDQMKSMLDDLALSGSENSAQLQTRLQSALDKSKALTEFGEKVTGNKMAEEYNRFVAAHVAKQIADIRIGAGLMPEEGLNAFMNTFVNRTQTNTLASQRPLLFQGPVGQAIGLFQSFQFNTMQQLFRGVSEGGPKDAAMLLGLQGTIFGLNGLPGFQYINQHIIGTASGNKDHTDAYSALYGSAGKTAGDWLMYGIPSNMLQTNIYSRGDINPRTLTVVPVNPADIVAVSAFTKFAGNLKETLGKVAGGGDVWQSVLQGFEHNGLSRPLVGLAQTMQAAGGDGKVFSTTNKGDVSFVNDFMSLATLSRLAGGKPLDEALANDELSRSIVYKAADKQRMQAATETFKSSVIGGGTPPEEATKNYMAAFVRNGGRAEDFNKNMLNAMTQANTPKANLIIQSTKGPWADHMKSLMGGKLADLNN